MKIKNKIPYTNTAKEIVSNISGQFLLYTSANRAASWIPMIFPKLLQDAQMLKISPLWDFGIQADSIATSIGKTKEFEMPIREKTI